MPFIPTDTTCKFPYIYSSFESAQIFISPFLKLYRGGRGEKGGRVSAGELINQKQIMGSVMDWSKGELGRTTLGVGVWGKRINAVNEATLKVNTATQAVD